MKSGHCALTSDMKNRRHELLTEDLAGREKEEEQGEDNRQKGKGGGR